MQRTRRHPFAWPRLALLASLALLPAHPVLAAPDIADKFAIGSGGGTDHKPQSKLWFNDGTWWAIAFDGSSQRIWKFDGGLFVKQTYADAAVDGRATSRADVLWDGTYLHVLSWHDVTPRFSKYSYDSSTQTYARLPGFPIDLPIPGTEVMVFDQDSTGRLWAAFELGGDIRVIWSVSPDHLSWNTTGVAIENHVDSDDIATVVASWPRTRSSAPSSTCCRRPCGRTRTRSRSGRSSRSRWSAGRSRGCRRRGPSTRSTSTRGGWRASTSAGARWPVGGSAGRTATTTSAPRSWAS